MPKSKRNKQVTLSKTKKKGREHKESIVSTIREAVEQYNSAYVFSFENMRNIKFKVFPGIKQSDAGGSRPICFRRDQVLRGDSGLLLTNLPNEEVHRLFNEFEEYDFARTGTLATEKVELNEGPLDQFTHEMEPFLRKQGMPVRLNKAYSFAFHVHSFKVMLSLYVNKLNHEVFSFILRLMGIKMATFRLHLLCRWSPEDFEVYQDGLENSDIETS
ncbi:hypothetical protein Leryth_025611 [Lithospermum erythrorhizon]|nr:hypothetical protein Leryth_025611 [Lithospermum erythrorhizon]